MHASLSSQQHGFQSLHQEVCFILTSFNSIREYGSTLYVGIAPKKHGRPYISIASDELKSLVIYTYKFLHTYLFISSVCMTTNTI